MPSYPNATGKLLMPGKDLITPDFHQSLRTLERTMVKSGHPHKFSAYMVAPNQTIANNTLTNVTFNATRTALGFGTSNMDPNNSFTPSGLNVGRYTVRRSGWWFLSSRVVWSGFNNATGQAYIGFAVNGTQVALGPGSQISTLNGFGSSANAIVTVNAGATVNVQALQTSGGNSVLVNDPVQTDFSGHWLSDLVF